MEGNFTLPRPNSPQRTRRTQRVDGFHDTFPISHRGHRAGGYPSPHNTNDRSPRAKRGGSEIVTSVGRQARNGRRSLREVHRPTSTDPSGGALGMTITDPGSAHPLRAFAVNPSKGAWREGKLDSPEGVQAPAGRPRGLLAMTARDSSLLPIPYSPLVIIGHCSLIIDHCSLASPHHSTICRLAAYLL